MVTQLQRFVRISFWFFWAVEPARESENVVLDLLCRCVGVWYICGILRMSGLYLVRGSYFEADTASIASSQ